MQARFPRLYAFFSVSDAFWLGACVMVWLLMWIDTLIWQAVGILAGLWWVWLRFRQVRTLVFWLALCLLPLCSCVDRMGASEHIPREGSYQIREIRSGYAIASDGRDSVLVYEKKDLALEERVYLSCFEQVHTERNIGLFSFMEYASSKAMYYSAGKVECIRPEDKETAESLDDHTVKKKKDTLTNEGMAGDLFGMPVSFSLSFSLPFTFRKPVWVWMASRKAAPLYQLLFYGIHTDENLEWLGSLGLPLIGFVHVLRAILKRWMEPQKAGWIVLGLEVLLTILFPVSVSLTRMICFAFCTQCFSNREKRLAFSVLLTLSVCPNAARSMALVMPAGILFFSRFQSGPFRKKLIQLCFCILCQMMFMNKVNGLLLLVFGSLRKAVGWFVLAALPGLVFEEYGLFLSDCLANTVVEIERFDLHGYPPFWYVLALALWLLSISWKWKKGRALWGVALLMMYPFIWRFDPFFHVYLLDIGQGDATVIVSPFQKDVIMIDAAGRFNHDNASELFLPFFESRQIRKLDALVVTHGDFDHDGSVKPLMEQFPVDQLIDSSDQKVDAGFSFELLLPQREADPEDENDQSLICFFAYDGFRYLWTGDASSRIEEQLIGQYTLKADVLKLGHHGSKTSSCRDFLKEVSCELALISAGYQNRFGHPDVEVLARLNELGIDRLNTADHGMIHLTSFHGLLCFQSADGLCGMISSSK